MIYDDKAYDRNGVTMKKIAIIGSGGAGKSTLARQLGEALHLPVIHLDALFWQPGWVPTEEQEWDKQLAKLVAQERWIIDGNYGRTMDVRLEAADTIIFLDYPTLVCLTRVIKRRIQYHNKTRPDMREGCHEKIDRQFLNWVWRYRRDKRPSIIEKLNSYSSSKKVLVFTSDKKLRHFMMRLKR